MQDRAHVEQLLLKAQEQSQSEAERGRYAIMMKTLTGLSDEQFHALAQRALRRVKLGVVSPMNGLPTAARLTRGATADYTTRYTGWSTKT